MPDVRRGEAVHFFFDGAAIAAQAGESVACALLAAGVRELRRSPQAGEPRGLFCLMGSCQECLVAVEGRRQLACQVPVAAGLQVRTLAWTETGGDG